MFSVYGVSGRQFTGSAEQLRQIEQVNAAARLRRMDANEAELPGRPSADATLWPPPRQDAAAPAPAPMARQALAAYAQTQPRETQRQPVLRVAEIMSQPAFTLTQDTPVLEAWRLLDYHGRAQAPVVSGSGMLVGLVLRGELLPVERLAVAEPDPQVWRTLMAQPIAERMWTPVPSVTPEADIRRVAGVLHEGHLPGLPVVDDTGMVTGFVSRGDIVRAVAQDPPLDLWG